MKKIFLTLILLINLSILPMEQKDLNEQLIASALYNPQKIIFLINEGAQTKIEYQGMLLVAYCYIDARWESFGKLIKYCDVNACDQNGNSILHSIAYHLRDDYLSFCDFTDIRNNDTFLNYKLNIRFLIYSGIDIYKRNNEGKTALNIAMELRKQNLIHLIDKYDTFIRERKEELCNTDGVDFKLAGLRYKAYNEQLVKEYEERCQKEIKEREEQ